MKLRFETSMGSTTWSYPFGSIIEVSKLTPEVEEWIAKGIVTVLRDPDADLETPEATMPAYDQASGKAVLPDGRPFVPRLCPGVVVVCLGGGPSLTQADVEACRGQATVIAINDAYKKAPWADVIYAADAAWWRYHWKRVGPLPGLKYSIRSSDLHVPEPDVIHFLDNTGHSGLEREPTGLRNGKNSGYQAINLGVHLGAKRIVLLGYDMQAKHGKPSHWFGEHPSALNRNSPYREFLELFPSLIKPLAHLGVEVVNASRETALTCFPRASLAEALSLACSVAA